MNFFWDFFRINEMVCVFMARYSRASEEEGAAAAAAAVAAVAVAVAAEEEEDWAGVRRWERRRSGEIRRRR